MSNRFKAVAMARLLLAEKVKNAAFLLDATAGNGFDTLFLAETSGKTAKIWAFDIQSQAIAATRQKLEEKGCAAKAHFVLDCHSRVKLYITGAIDTAMFNLGYLPRANHDIKTLPATTAAAIKETAGLLAPGGLISIIAYPGHAGGREEQAAVEVVLAGLAPEDFTVGCWSMFNRANCPPVLYIIKRRE